MLTVKMTSTEESPILQAYLYPHHSVIMTLCTFSTNLLDRVHLIKYRTTCFLTLPISLQTNWKSDIEESP